MKKKAKDFKRKSLVLIKRASVLALSLSVFMTAFPIPDITVKEVKADELESILLPIKLLDHRNDGLLFEYDLNNALINVLDLDHAVFNQVTGEADPGKGLVENTLGANGKPVYKREVVEKVAEIIKDYIDSNPTLDNDLFNQIASSIKSDNEAVLGSYDASASKFSVESANSSDISSCMDYAYYVMNNFWTDTDGDITKNTDTYDYIKLDKVGGLYEFTDEYPVNYDLDNRLISQENRDVHQNGFYPIDKALLGDEIFANNTFNEAEIDDYNHVTIILQ